MDPFSQELRLREAGVQRDHIVRDVGVSGATGTDRRHGWHSLDGRLAGGDTLVVVRIDRIGRRWLDTLQCIINLRSRGVKIRSLDETESWTQYLELDPDHPMAFVGHQMVAMAAWVANQEREVGRRSVPGKGWRRRRPGGRAWDAGGPSAMNRCNRPGG